MKVFAQTELPFRPLASMASDLLKRHPATYCLEVMMTADDLWDMRCWHRYKDPEEVERWIRSFCSPRGHYHKNCGHVGFCIDLALHGHGIPRQKIVEAILANRHVQFKDESFCHGAIIFSWLETSVFTHPCHLSRSFR